MSCELIVPVGTSMLTAWMPRLAPNIQVSKAWLAGDASAESNEPRQPDLRALIPQFTKSMREGRERTSAEIDSIRRWLAKQRDVQVSRVTLLVSDTAPAQWVATALQSLLPQVFEGSVTVESRLIRRLQAGDMREGLVEFIRVAAKAIKDSKDRGAQPVVNATPGFKAETSLLTLLGGLLGAETIYLHEHMQDIVSIPVVPLRWGLEPSEILLLKQIGEAATRDEVRDLGIARHPVLWSFIERIGDGPEEIWGLSALGQMVLESSSEAAEEPLPVREATDIKFEFKQKEAGHMPADAEQLAHTIGKQLPFVTVARLYKFDGAGKPGLLMPREDDAQTYAVRVRLQPTTSDMRLRYRLHTTATNNAQWQTARRLAAEAFGRVSLIDELAEDAAGSGDTVPGDETPLELNQLRAEDHLLAELNQSEIRVRDLAEQVSVRTQDLHQAKAQIWKLESKLRVAGNRKREQDELIKRKEFELSAQEATLVSLRAELAAAIAAPSSDSPDDVAPN